MLTSLVLPISAEVIFVCVVTCLLVFGSQIGFICLSFVLYTYSHSAKIISSNNGVILVGSISCRSLRESNKRPLTNPVMIPLYRFAYRQTHLKSHEKITIKSNNRGIPVNYYH